MSDQDQVQNECLEATHGSSLRTQPDILFTLPDHRIHRKVELIQFDIVMAPPHIGMLGPSWPCIHFRAKAANKLTPRWR